MAYHSESDPFLLKYSEKNTAILLFARSANEEARQKNFALNAPLKRNAAIGERLFQEAQKKCVQSKLPVFHLDEKAQKGCNFAERLKHSFQHVFDQGFKNVIAIGSDCPKLSVRDIHTAANKLASGSAVLGETQKGGIYLMALPKDVFNTIDFSQVHWNSEQVFSQLESTLLKKEDTFILDKKWECNSSEDCISHSMYLNNELSNWLLSQMNKPQANFNEFLSTVLFEFSESPESRGPPQA